MGATPELIAMASQAAKDAGIPEHLFMGLIQTESGWNVRAMSPVGARGLTQVMPFWLTSNKFNAWQFKVEDLFNPRISLFIGANILSDELQRFNGDWGLAAMAYNGGPTKVQSAIAKSGSRNAAVVSDYLKADETRNYWKKVLNWAAFYAGKISEVEAKTSDVASDALAYASSPGGGSALIAGGAVLLLGFWLMGR